MTDDGKRHSEEMTDRLIDRRERFGYFIMTAATAIGAYALKTLNDPTSLLRLARVELVFVGAGALLASVGIGLVVIRERHTKLWCYNQTITEGWTDQLRARFDAVKNRLTWEVRLMFGFFMLGLVVLFAAFVQGAVRLPPR